MTQELQLFNLLKSQYLNFVKKNKENDTITRYITEMNFISKLEKIALNGNLTQELENISVQKEKITKLLEAKGIRPKNN